MHFLKLENKIEHKDRYQISIFTVLSYKLKKEYEEKKSILNQLKVMEINDIWFQDLLKLEKEFEDSQKIKIKIKKSV